MRWRLSVLGWVFLAIGSSQLWIAWDSFSKDIHWTPSTNHEPLAKSATQCEIYVRHKPLHEVVAAGDLGLRSGDSWLALQPAELSVRLNHVNEVTRIPLAAGAGFSAAGLAWLLAPLVMTRRGSQT